MITINLLRRISASDIGQHQVLCKVATGACSAPYLPSSKPFDSRPLDSLALPPSLHSRLLERLLGKSPLRLVVERSLIEQGVWQEKLECGHEHVAFREFDLEDGRYIELPITAKRRRCRECAPEARPVLKSDAEIDEARARAALIRERQWKYGTLFEKLCYPNGEFRPGLSDNEESSGPRKPVQSVGGKSTVKKTKAEVR